MLRNVKGMNIFCIMYAICEKCFVSLKSQIEGVQAPPVLRESEKKPREVCIGLRLEVLSSAKL